MDNPVEIRKMAEQRLKAAEFLLDNDMLEEALYLAGHSVELVLKARICNHFNFPNLFNSSENRENIKRMIQVHDIDELMLLCGLYLKFAEFTGDQPSEILEYIIHIKKFNDIRYKKVGIISKEKSKKIISFIKEGLLHWIENN